MFAARMLTRHKKKQKKNMQMTLLVGLQCKLPKSVACLSLLFRNMRLTSINKIILQELRIFMSLSGLIISCTTFQYVLSFYVVTIVTGRYRSMYCSPVWDPSTTESTTASYCLS